jgi:hypothetical protein
MNSSKIPRCPYPGAPTVHVSMQMFSVGCVTFFPVVSCLGSSVGIATGYRLGDRGRGRSSTPGRVKNFHFSTASRSALGVHPTSYPMATGSPFPGDKAAGP